eukprot:tig00020553_g10770.t1
MSLAFALPVAPLPSSVSRPASGWLGQRCPHDKATRVRAERRQRRPCAFEAAPVASASTPGPSSAAQTSDAFKLCVQLAAARSAETARPEGERLIDDSLAARFAALLEDGGEPDAELQRLEAVRTRLGDEFLLERAVLVRLLPQAVLLGTGFDARPYRLPWGTNQFVYQVEEKDVADAKRETLDRLQAVPAGCKLFSVVAPLRDTQLWMDVLKMRGHDVNVATVWVIDGALDRLAQDEGDALLEAISDLSCEESWLFGDVATEGEGEGEGAAAGRFSMSDVESSFAKLGWIAGSFPYGEEETGFGRWAEGEARPARRLFTARKVRASRLQIEDFEDRLSWAPVESDTLEDG